MITPMTVQHWNKTIANHLKKGPEGKEGGGGGGWGDGTMLKMCTLAFKTTQTQGCIFSSKKVSRVDSNHFTHKSHK